MGDLPVTGWRIRGTVLPSGSDTELWIDGEGRFADGPLPAAQDLGSGGFLLPGLVDAHCHVGLGPDGPVTDLDECERQARTDRDAGTLLIRDCGSPVDTEQM